MNSDTAPSPSPPGVSQLRSNEEMEKEIFGERIKKVTLNPGKRKWGNSVQTDSHAGWPLAICPSPAPPVPASPDPTHRTDLPK